LYEADLARRGEAPLVSLILDQTSKPFFARFGAKNISDLPGAKLN
jgi:hypothetical protein